MLHDWEKEIGELAAEYGVPHRHTALLPTTDFEPVSMRDRVGEVCMVIRRPNGNLITAIKTTYPPGAHRLLTGGVHPTEPIFTALLREVAEETALDVVVRRFLATVEYQTIDAQPVFRTSAFLLDEVGGTLRCDDPDEKHAAFYEIGIDELPERAIVLEQTGAHFVGQGEDWAAWGQFRAIIHRVVWECLERE